MPTPAALSAWAVVVGAVLPAGAAVAAVLGLGERVAALLTAFGGGILLAAVAFELAPGADRLAGSALTAAGLAAGALLYVAADVALTRDSTRRAMRRSAHAAAAGRSAQPGDPAAVARGESIAAGLVIDGIPESVALGLTIAEGEIGVALLVGVVVGNLVEAYGAAQPIVAGGRSGAFAVRLLGLIGLALAIATVLGGTVLSAASSGVVGTAQAVAAGALLAVITIAIVPHAFEEVSTSVASATVGGFVVGYLLG